MGNGNGNGIGNGIGNGNDDFGFLVGTWDVANRRLADGLDPDSGWEEFPGTSRATRHFGGAANFDEIEFPTKGAAGLTLRLYDHERGRWTLNWASARTGTLFPAVVGRFEEGAGTGRGVFEGEDSHGDTPVLVRFVWSGTRTDSPRWEQYFSADRGGSWILNWTMDFTRRTPRPDSDSAVGE
ncbi:MULTISPECIES: hypothetical protein [unclassified Streptomyces]|uniref:hypothetical protein n=1 Tax=unclassified Streptomyces TaxID=2593676 RepID=UPI000DC7B291|nr:MULTISPECIES: hypothetical protein [unclassified Streptomyces]AWZ09356.1 hypothetical protein DRB89_38310 [Streptomyces sp. ICC4]AWZ16948.1 hypothetical protein DRB96_37670 [Streptomyces sp. ICC1]